MLARWIQGDGEGSQETPGEKYYDEVLHDLNNTSEESIKATYPPFFNDLSAAWAALLVEFGSFNPAQRKNHYPTVFG